MPELLTLGLFEAVGIEAEYMIVDRNGLDVLPVCERVLAAQAGCITSEDESDDINWSNELVLHVIELKTAGPARDWERLPGAFQLHVERVNEQLAPLGGRLMPTAMHPWMDPYRETRLWPHEYNVVYETFDRIFDCRGHGWSNLQSLHVNVPFADDEEFGRLHAAVRLLLPILPAIAASSPVVEGRVNGVLDNRLAAYRTNCARVPSITARIIPEPVFTLAAYHESILQPVYRDLAPYDPQRVLQHEWVNARGAIGRFDRNTIEIRVLDVQECPAADLAIAAAVTAVLKLIVAQTWSDLAAQQAWATDPLAGLLEATIRDGDLTVIEDDAYLHALGWPGPSPCTAGQLWRHLIDEARSRLPAALAFCEDQLETILRHGPLARRILRALGPQPSRSRLAAVYRLLCDCLAAGEMFLA